jgi:hypothetical protein
MNWVHLPKMRRWLNLSHVGFADFAEVDGCPTAKVSIATPGGANLFQASGPDAIALEEAIESNQAWGRILEAIDDDEDPEF